MENQLEVIVKDSGLEPTKAKYILEQFQDYFMIASEWEKKAKALVVTDGSQKAEMEMARTGRLFLREKRIAIEKARKDLKEQSLREGKAIDGIANVLKALIMPIEEYLEQQEKYVEIQEEKKQEAKRQEIERRMAEEERLAQEKAAAEQERLRLENEKLKEEAAKREMEIQIENKKREDLLTKERARAEDEKRAAELKARKEREAIEERARVEREKQAKKLTDERAKAEAEREAIEKKARDEKARQQAKMEIERKEKERLAEILASQVECPFCHKKFSIDKSKRISSHYVRTVTVKNTQQ